MAQCPFLEEDEVRIRKSLEKTKKNVEFAKFSRNFTKFKFLLIFLITGYPHHPGTK